MSELQNYIDEFIIIIQSIRKKYNDLAKILGKTQELGLSSDLENLSVTYARTVQLYQQDLSKCSNVDTASFLEKLDMEISRLRSLLDGLVNISELYAFISESIKKLDRLKIDFKVFIKEKQKMDRLASEISVAAIDTKDKDFIHLTDHFIEDLKKNITNGIIQVEFIERYSTALILFNNISAETRLDILAKLQEIYTKADEEPINPTVKENPIMTRVCEIKHYVETAQVAIASGTKKKIEPIKIEFESPYQILLSQYIEDRKTLEEKRKKSPFNFFFNLVAHHKSFAVKKSAAKKLRDAFNDQTVEFKDHEIAALKDGKLGDILKEIRNAKILPKSFIDAEKRYDDKQARQLVRIQIHVMK